MRPSSFIVSVVSIVCAIDRVEYKGFLLSIYTTEVKVAGNDVSSISAFLEDSCQV